MITPRLLLGITLGILLPAALMLVPLIFGLGLNRLCRRKGRSQ